MAKQRVYVIVREADDGFHRLFIRLFFSEEKAKEWVCQRKDPELYTIECYKEGRKGLAEEVG